MIFVDASALIAILAKEVGRDEISARIDADPDRLYSAMSRWEELAGLCKSHSYSPQAARLAVDDFLETFAFRIVSIGSRESDWAAQAHERYGRGRHPAALNMGDCFAYACAKSSSAALIYKGDDFARTDLA